MKKLLIIGIALSANAFASNMVAPIMFPTAQVLPEGVRNVNFKGAWTNPDTVFKQDGEKAGLANPMNMKITGADLIIGKDNHFDRAGVLQKLRAAGLDEDTVLAESIGQVNAQVQVSAPILAWGLTAKWTTAIVVPIKRYSLNIDTGVRVSKAQKKALTLVRQNLLAGGQGKEVEELERKLADPIRWKARDYGYDEIPSVENRTQLGDIQLINKYQIINKPIHQLTLTGALTVPTGKQMLVDQLVNIPGGDGQTDISLGANYDLKLGRYITISSSVAYTAQFKDTVERRIPEQAKSLVGREKDNNISRNLGDIIGSSLASTFKMKGATLGFGYNFQHKNEDSYEGAVYETHRYDWLAKDSEQNMHSLLAKIGYDTIDLYKAGKFPMPLLFSVTHTQIVAGKNVVKNPLTTLDISMFF